MLAPTQTHSPKSYARLAGVLYLVIIVCGVGGQAFVREPIVADTAAQTVDNLLAAETAFRVGILADVAMVLADVALGVVLYVLLAPAGRTLSRLAMTMRLAQAAVLGLNLVHLQQALSFAHASGLDAATRDVLVVSSLDAHAAGYDLGLFFFAVDCLLVGWLIYRSGFLPRMLGVGIVVSGGVYLVGSTLRFVAPDLAASFAVVYVVPLVAELALSVWLLAGRLDVRRWMPRARPASAPAAATG